MKKFVPRDIGPRWSFNRYAFGYTDKKPWGAVLLIVAIILVDLFWLRHLGGF